MIAGALVNEKDIGKSLFTPDVKLPSGKISPDEHIFFSTLPQAVSTEAEMMTRYTSSNLEGIKKCIQRIHVTGGTNGIRIDALRKYRPFTPSFIGRAEDQAYIFSALFQQPARLAYVHKDGLIMRHDKEAFAKQAIESAYIGKLLGDFIRILFFSHYARILAGNVTELKQKVDPFTGCFISRIPATVVYLRFALKAASFWEEKDNEKGYEFVRDGFRRIERAILLIDSGELKRVYERERNGWNLYYDILDMIEIKGKVDGLFLEEIRSQAKKTLTNLTSQL
jgi:hypothetical protein